MPRVGVWTADVEVDTKDVSKFADKVELSVNQGALEYVGKASTVGANGDQSLIRMVGGRCGMGKAVGPKFYKDVPARIPVKDALDAGGEELSSTSGLDTQLPWWTRREGTVGEAFGQLLEEVGSTWRVQSDGKIWVGTDTWPAASLRNAAITLDAPEDGRMELISDLPSLVPGTTFQGRKISRVTHYIEPESVKSVAWVEKAESGTGDVMLAAFEKIIRKFCKRIDYMAMYPARVVSQNGDGSLELKPDDTRLPGMSKVPIRYGIPGVKVKVPSGARVAIEFERADPARPVATVWDGGLKEIEITASTVAKVNAPRVELAGGGPPIARVGDSVLVAGVLTGVITSGSSKAGSG